MYTHRMNTEIMGGYFGVLFGYYLIHNFIWKHTIYFPGGSFKPGRENQIQRTVFFTVGLAILGFGINTIWTHGI